VDAKDIKCLLEWWKKHETIVPIIGFASFGQFLFTKINFSRFFDCK